jgi:hypothetical protein
MKHLVLLVLVSLASIVPVHAQSAGSEHFRRFDIGWNVLSYARQSDRDLVGGNLSFAIRKSERLGFVADLAIHETVPFSSTRITTYRFGPRFYAPEKGRITAFGEILAGGARARTSSTFSFFGGGSTTTTSPAINGFALAAGGGLDVRIKPWFAWRMIQADYSLLRLAGDTSNGVRVDTGIVFRFGH